MVRRSRYLAALPPLPVHCTELDGDLTTLPIIFEDQYQDMAEFARRRSVAGRKAGSGTFPKHLCFDIFVWFNEYIDNLLCDKLISSSV